MKIQYLAVIFVIIVLPISLVISLYTGNLIKVSNTEAAYNRLLFNATHDAVRTYQMNTLDNTYAAEDTSKFRDVNASINSFYNNLGTGLSRSGYSKEELYEYVPAILFNLYDGFYIYSPYQNIAVENGENAAVYGGANEGTGDTAYSKILLKRAAEKGTISDGTPPRIDESGTPQQGGKFVDASYLDYYNESPILTNEPEFGLQNYNYYACEYKGKTRSGGNYDIVINYTLDNFMRVYGVVDNEFYKYEGYYIYTGGLTPGVTGDWRIEGINEEGVSLGSVDIEPEKLGEYVAYYDPYTVYYHKNGAASNGQTQRVIYQRKGHEGIKYFNYIIYNGVKYYLDTEHLNLRNETDALDMHAVDTAGTDINKGSSTPNGYALNKFQYINYYTQTGDTEAEREITKQYNVSFNDTYQGIPIFKLDGKQRIYMSRQELIDIMNYMDGYYPEDMILAPNAGGEITSINNFFGNINRYWRDLNDVYYYTNASFFSDQVNKNIFKKIILDLNPGTPDSPNDNYSVVSDAYNMKYTAYFEFDENEGKSDDENERYYLHQKYNYGDNSKFVFHSWGLVDASGNADGAKLENVNPDLDTSLFNQHRIDVITSCIEYSFANAVENFNDYMESAYKYKIPDISDSDWGKIANNISCLTMMQGMPIGNYKFYNNYSLVIDNKVNEFTPKSGIYVEDNYQAALGGADTVEFNSPNLQTLKNSANPNSLYITGKYLTNREVVFHNPGCSEYHNDVGGTRDVVGYRVIDYDIDSYVPAADLKGYLQYTNSGVKHPNDDVGEQHDKDWIPFFGETGEPYELGRQVFFYLRPGTGCYNCVISQNKLDFSIDDILGFRSAITLGTGEETLTLSNNVRQAYMRALARERGAKARYSKDIYGNSNFGNVDPTTP